MPMCAVCTAERFAGRRGAIAMLTCERCRSVIPRWHHICIYPDEMADERFDEVPVVSTALCRDCCCLVKTCDACARQTFTLYHRKNGVDRDVCKTCFDKNFFGRWAAYRHQRGECEEWKAKFEAKMKRKREERAAREEGKEEG